MTTTPKRPVGQIDAEDTPDKGGVETNSEDSDNVSDAMIVEDSLDNVPIAPHPPNEDNLASQQFPIDNSVNKKTHSLMCRNTKCAQRFNVVPCDKNTINNGCSHRWLCRLCKRVNFSLCYEAWRDSSNKPNKITKKRKVRHTKDKLRKRSKVTYEYKDNSHERCDELISVYKTMCSELKEDNVSLKARNRELEVSEDSQISSLQVQLRVKDIEISTLQSTIALQASRISSLERSREI